METRTVGGYGLGNKEAEVIRIALEKIREQQGELKPALVVEAARSSRSPLHKHFVWDDTEAAHSYRLSQAARLIRQVKIEVIESPNKKPLRVNSYVSVVRDSGRQYRPVMEVLSDDDDRDQLLSEALQALRAIKRKYATLSELTNLIREIEVVEMQVATKKRKRLK